MSLTMNDTVTTNDLAALALEIFQPDSLRRGALSGPRARLPESVLKVEINPVLLRGERKYQFAYHQQQKVTHRNLAAPEAQTELVTLLSTQFKQGIFHTPSGEVHVLLNKRHEVTVRRVGRKEEEKKRRREEENAERGMMNDEYHTESHSSLIIHHSSLPSPSTFPHDRAKNHILPEGEAVPFLVKLGVMSADGKVIAAKRDKFRQINRFLEMVADVTEPLMERARQFPGQPLRIVDFGCGKGYLTFALYHYLHTLRGLNLSLRGVDVKRDVLAQLTTLAEELDYSGLSFLVSDIRSVTREQGTEDNAERGMMNDEYNAESHSSLITQHSSLPASPTTVSLVVALHACDTATDDALAKAVAWNARVILAAPCCQHELYSKIENDALGPMLRHGIIRERLNALVTDTLRAELLAAHGYHVQMLEFVDAEHTPKNLLIRATQRTDTEKKTANAAENAALREAAQETYARFREFWHVQPYMEQALGQAMSNQSVPGQRPQA